MGLEESKEGIYMNLFSTEQLNLSNEPVSLAPIKLPVYDENGKFYREICTPYNSENGTDVLLDDREEYIYSTIESEMACPSFTT